MPILFVELSTFSRIKALLFMVSLALILGYDYIPAKQQQIYPASNAAIDLFSDQQTGGESTVMWVNQAHSQYECDIANANQAYCGVSISWRDEHIVTIDLSDYDSLIIDASYEGNAQGIEVIARSVFKASQGDATVTDKTMTAFVDTTKLNGTMEIKLKDFRVPDWWISSNRIAPEDTHPYWNELIALGFNSSPPFAIGPSRLTLNNISISGVYFSKEQLYLGLLVFWAAVLSGQGAWQYLALRRRVLADEAKLSELAAISEQYRVQAETDGLTGLSNREGLAQTLSTIERMGDLDNFALLILDIDLFKQVNDSYGHDIGDQVLEEMGRLIKQNCRQTDLVSRWGGEEFVVLFRCQKAKDTKLLAEKIRLEIARSRFSEKNIQLTATIGATKLSQHESFTEAFKRADKALYKGKRHGRNRLVEA
ncbi:MAG: GGDEF domain-containing protein [Alteromonadaceae bacterium]|nr:GGDEF domain-containing protein [Alteromonadaceae bacterium]